MCSAVTTAPRTTSDMKLPSSTSKLNLLSLVLLLTACVAGPENTLTDFYAALEKGNIQAAQSLVSSRLQSQLGPAKTEAMLMQESKTLNACGGTSSVTTDLTGEGEVRFGKVTVKFKGDCKVRQHDVSLVREDGKWKITAQK